MKTQHLLTPTGVADPFLGEDPTNPAPLPAMHFTAVYLLNPTNPVTVNLLGAGGTGSQVLTALCRMHTALLALDHPGLHVRVWDFDRVSTANLGRQLFAPAELGLNKAVALVNRVNRFFGTRWQAIPMAFCLDSASDPERGIANLTISCVDTVAARFAIHAILTRTIAEQPSAQHGPKAPLYWLDFGNGQQTGQFILATVGKIPQPTSQRYRTVDYLPSVTEEFGELLAQADQTDTGPSCSLAEALTKQDLFINSTLAAMGAALLWSLFRTGMSAYRGGFLNLTNCRSQPLAVG
jgi:PRTRC genetic system ThiF family protein